MQVSQSPYSKAIIELPYGLEKSKIYRTVMPGLFSSEPNIDDDILELKIRDISHLVLLTSNEEAYYGTGKTCDKLSEKYQQHGFTVRQFPIVDRSIPDNTELSELLKQIQTDADEGKNIAIHCWGGKGRTGLVAACLARKIFHISGEEAVAWVRERVPGAVETEEQSEYVNSFIEQEHVTLFEKSITHLPFGFEKGNIYRCTMPGYRRNNPDIQSDINVLKSKKISHVVLLTSNKEAYSGTGGTCKNLRKQYEKAGFTVLQFPIPEGGVPDNTELSPLLEQIMKGAEEGNNIAIHCMGGNGRTGLVAACLARKAFNISGEDAITWLRRSIPDAVETVEQMEYVDRFVEEEHLSLFEKSLTPLPFGFEKGSIFRCEMPGYSRIKPDIKADIKALKSKNITQVVLLATTSECINIAGCDLKKEYEEAGIKVIHLPVNYRKTPDKEALKEVFSQMHAAASEGGNIAVHCVSGTGRTGLVVACLARIMHDLPAEEAIVLTRESIPGAVETKDQKRFVENFIENKTESTFSRSLTLLPYPIEKGGVYRSVMPGYRSDKENIKDGILRDILTLKTQGITKVVMLAPEEEAYKLLGVDLKEEYLKHGIAVRQLPVKDGSVPSKVELLKLLKEILEVLNQGKKIAIHCRGGTGRTGVVAACLARVILKLNGEDAVKWTRKSITGAVHTPQQKQFVNECLTNNPAN